MIFCLILLKISFTCICKFFKKKFHPQIILGYKNYKKMDINSLIKLVKTFTFDTTKELQQYTEVQTGKGVFT